MNQENRGKAPLPDWATNTDRVIADNIAARRRMLNMSRAKLAHYIFYSKDWVRRVEQGRPLPASILLAIGKALQLRDPLVLLRFNAFKQHDFDFDDS